MLSLGLLIRLEWIRSLRTNGKEIVESTTAPDSDQIGMFVFEMHISHKIGVP